jgi:hypothetical protein
MKYKILVPLEKETGAAWPINQLVDEKEFKKYGVNPAACVEAGLIAPAEDKENGKIQTK